MDPLNRKMNDRIDSIRIAINNKLLILPPIDTIAVLIGVTADEMRESLTAITKDCSSYQHLLRNDSVLVNEPTIIKCEEKLNAFENAPLMELVPTFTAMHDFVKAQLEAARAKVAKPDAPSDNDDTNDAG